MGYAAVSAQRYSDETSEDYEAFPTPYSTQPIGNARLPEPCECTMNLDEQAK
jgi:hypothetical protein